MTEIDMWVKSKYLSSPPILLMRGGGTSLSQHAGNNGWTALLSVIIGIVGVILVFVVIGVFLYLTVSGRMEEIQSKWPEHRCKINIMPIAGWIGPPGTSTAENFKTCMEDFMGNYISRKFSPLFDVFDSIFSVLWDLRNSVQQMRKSIFSIRNTLASLANDIFKRIKNLYIRLFTIMKRILVLISYLILTFRNNFYVLKYSFFVMKGLWEPVNWMIQKVNVLTDVVNTMRTPIDAVSSFFCFHPLQCILCSSSEKYDPWYIVTMDGICPGSFVNRSLPTEVVGKWVFWNGTGKWYQVGGGIHNGWLMTGSHIVFDQRYSKWARAEKPRNNTILNGTITTICPWTQTGYIEGHKNCWTVDFWGPTTFEFETRYWSQMLTQVRAAGIPLRGDDLYWASNKWDYTSMIMGDLEVKLHDGTWKTIERLNKTDILWNYNNLYGKACALAKIFNWTAPGVSVGTWIKQGPVWTNINIALLGEPIVKKNGLCYQLATSNESFFIRNQLYSAEYEIRDTCGWLFPTVETWRENTLISDLNKLPHVCEAAVYGVTPPRAP